MGRVGISEVAFVSQTGHDFKDWQPSRPRADIRGPPPRLSEKRLFSPSGQAQQRIQYFILHQHGPWTPVERSSLPHRRHDDLTKDNHGAARPTPETDKDIPRYANPTRSGTAAGPHLHASRARRARHTRACAEPVRLSRVSRISLRRSPPPRPADAGGAWGGGHRATPCAHACFWKVVLDRFLEAPVTTVLA